MPVARDFLEAELSTNVLASSPTTSNVSRLARGPAEVEDSFLQDQPAAHERPFAALDLDQLAGQQLVADHAILDEDTGIDRCDVIVCPGAVVRPSRSSKWISKLASQVKKIADKEEDAAPAA